MTTGRPLRPSRGSGKLLNLSLLALFLICSVYVIPEVGHELIAPQPWELTSSNAVFRRAADSGSSDGGSIIASNANSNSNTVDQNNGSNANSNTDNQNNDSTSSDDPNDIVIDPLTPAGTAKFTFPKPYVKPADITIFPINEVMTIKWEWNNIVIMPRLITIQINSPGVTAKIQGSTVQNNNDRWFPVALNISANRDQYQWLVNVTDRAGYQLRIFDSEVGPIYAGKPGRLALSTSAKFNLYVAGQDPSYLEMYTSGANWGSPISWIQTAVVVTGVVILGYWI